MNENIHAPITITPHLFQLGVPSFPVYLSVGEEAMLIEGGTGPTFDIIVKQIEMLGIDPAKITRIALTHTHADHVGAVPRLRQIWPHVKIVGGKIAAKFLSKESFTKRFLPMDDMIGGILKQRGEISQTPDRLETYNFAVDSVVEAGDTIDLGGGIVWQVHNSPGHSPCHISFFEEKEKLLTIGDMTGYFDPERDVFWPNYFTSLSDYCDSIRNLAKLPGQKAILSHNGVLDGDTSAYLHKALKATEAFHNEILAKLDSGEDEKQICKGKADWIEEIGALATYDALVALNGMLLNNSVADREKDLFIFP